ncbi:MAG: hypothetical protein LUC18_00445 [Porphyromonadaceae bacterium]|nr:hypothetical protein [Porphyromonadaceae bacterium]
MRMKKGGNHRVIGQFFLGRIRKGLLSAFLMAAGSLCLITSCIREYAPAAEDVPDPDTAMVSIAIKAAKSELPDGFEYGSKWENYMDFSGTDCRIYFFTNKSEYTGYDDTYIAQLEIRNVDVVDKDDWSSYRVYGIVPSEVVTGYCDFRLVILANWGESNYPTEEQLEGMTLEELCHHDDDVDDGRKWGEYDAMTDCSLNEDNLIPMYGAEPFSDVAFNLGTLTELEDPVYMIRAMAKIEIVNNSNLPFGDVVLHGLNTIGECAPEWVYSYSDLESYLSIANFWKTTDVYGFFPNVVNTTYTGIPYPETGLNAKYWRDYNNDNDYADNTLQFVKASGSGTETWYAYVPEFISTQHTFTKKTSLSHTFPEDRFLRWVKNTDDYIQINILGMSKEDPRYQVWLTDYTDGSPAAGSSTYDLRRNLIYRFYIDIDADNTLSVTVDGWEAGFTNSFEIDGSEED